MKHLVALVSGLGWHVSDLLRAAETLGVRLEPAPFPALSGWVGRNCSRIEVAAAGSAAETGARGFGDEQAHAPPARRPERAGAGPAATNLLQTDGVLVRMMPPGTLEQVVFRMDALHRVAAAGVPVLNPPGAVEAAVDKYLALARIEAAGLPVPQTWAGETAAAALEAFEALGGDVVVKPLFGSEGRGLLRVSDRELAGRAFATLERLGAVLYLQRFVPHPGHDLRAFVLNGRVLGAIRRHAPAGDWRTNVSRGGRPERCALDSFAERLALSAARAIGATMAGVDLLPDAWGELTVLEVNAVPGWRALSAATGIDVASEIVCTLRDGA